MKKEIESKLTTPIKSEPIINKTDSSVPESVKKPKKIFRKIIISIILFSLLAIVFGQQEEKINDKYSADQQKIISEFGLPDTFQVIQNLETEELETRSEIWRYLKLGEIFSFENGKFLARTHQDFGLDSESKLVTIKIEPADVYNLTTLEEINQLVGGEPNYNADINPELLVNAKLYNYDNLLTVGLIDNRISWIRTMAGIEASLTKATPSPSDEEWKKGRVFSEDNQFSVFVDLDVAQNLVALKELQNEAQTHHFCYSEDNVEQDFFCNGWGRPLFTIVEYTEADYQEFLETPMVDTELFLAKRDGKVYTLTHPNGDVPDIIMGRANDFYDMVIESFVFTDQM